MFWYARQNNTPENGNTATNNTARVISPVSASTRSTVSPAQSTSIARPGS